MFPCEGSKFVSVCSSLPREKKSPTFVNICFALKKMLHQWKGLHKYYSMETEKFDLRPKKIILNCILT